MARKGLPLGDKNYLNGHFEITIAICAIKAIKNYNFTEIRPSKMLTS